MQGAKGMTRRRLKGQKSINLTVTVCPAEAWLIKDEAEKTNLGLSGTFRKILQAYFGDEYYEVLSRFAQIAVEESEKSETEEDTNDHESKQNSSSTQNGTEQHSDTSTATV